MSYITYPLNGWQIQSTQFSPDHLQKFESICCQGNGYLGIRNALEESYVEEHRGMFVAGTFDRADSNSVPELPNMPDITAAAVWLDGERFSLTELNQEAYTRTMDYRTGESVRSVVFCTTAKKRVRFCFRRFVSLAREHAVAAAMTIEPLDAPVRVKIESGIDARVTNTGVQHLIRFDGRIIEDKYMQSAVETRESGIFTVIHTVHRFFLNGSKTEADAAPYIRNRRNLQILTLDLKPQDCFTLEKLSSVMTTRDLAYEGMAGEEASAAVKQDGLHEIKELAELGYDALFRESRAEWDAFWKTRDIVIESSNHFDQLAARFAVYHLHIMNRDCDARLGVGAKGLSGEEYCGHSFWDTEIFLMPFYLYTNPKAARTLLEYRYHILDGARRKAEKAGYRGAMYPWEAAWITDDETCLDVIGVDVETGEPMRVLCGEIEVHISADVAYAVWEYYQATGDDDFMNRCGYEMLLETALFWTSRVSWAKEKARYEIHNVIGPDEYKEEVDNDVYTNYMAYYNLKTALQALERMPEDVRRSLGAKIGMDLEEAGRTITEVMDRLYLPVPDENGIIAQNDTYLSLKELALDKYKNSGKAGSIHEDYSIARLKEYQVSKQGDLVVLLFLLEELFGKETKRINYEYYEKHTLHDSSLSKCTHSILANDLNMEEAYPFYAEAAAIDAGQNMHSSDNGIHSASCGGIWQCVVQGFGGVRMTGGKLRILPKLPKEWTRLQYRILWQGCPLRVSVVGGNTTVTNYGAAPVTVILADGEHIIEPSEGLERERLKYEGVIFDLDGVICHTDRYHYEAWKTLADRLGIYFDEEINNRLRGVSRMESLDIILERAGKAYTQEEKKGFADEKNEIYKKLLRQMRPADLAAEVKRTLDALRGRGLKLAIGSSSKNACFILERIGLGGYFDAVADGTQISRSKPDPEVFLKAAQYLGITPDKALVVEDAAAGIAAAAAGGMDSALIGAEEAPSTYRLSGFGDLEAIAAGSRR